VNYFWFASGILKENLKELFVRIMIGIVAVNVFRLVPANLCGWIFPEIFDVVW
jgi:hypothetical protein